MSEDLKPCPRFGDIIENGWASEGNPTRVGFFVRAGKRTGRLNAGSYYEVTDGAGKFWELPSYGDHKITVRHQAPLGAATAPSTGDSDKVPGTPPDTSWNKRASPPGGEWRWVPVEPTEEMIAAAKPAFKEVEDMILYCHARGSHRGGLQNGDPLPVAWKAMLSAAPPREAVGVGIEGVSRTESGGSPPLRAAKSDSQEGH